MPFIRPTLQEIITRTEEDIKSGLGLPTLLRRSVEKVLARVLAGSSHTLHGHIQDFAAKQLFPNTSDDEFLVSQAGLWGLTRNEATFTQLQLSITGTNGSVLTAGTIYQRSDGTTYSVDADVTIVAGVATPTVTAEDSGAATNIDDASEVSLESPVAGIDGTATVSSTLVEGEDEESIEALRVRLLQRIQQPPAGGTVNDYIAFALQVTGVTRVWVLPGNRGQGTVDVTFVEDGEDPIIPSPAKVQEVQDSVDLQKPVTADSVVFAPLTQDIDLTIELSPNTLAVQTAVLAELEDLIFTSAQVKGAVVPDEVGLGSTYDGRIPLSQISEAISRAEGEVEHRIISPTADPEPLNQGTILQLGTVTFNPLVP